MNRRGFLGAMLAAAAAEPAIVRAQSLMPVKPPAIWTPSDTIFTGEIGRCEGFRFYESDHITDAMLYGVSIARIMRPVQHLTTKALRRAVDAIEVQRVEPYVAFVHPEWAHDLRKAGIPVKRLR